MKHRFTNRSGFTLIELMITVVILVILAVASVSIYTTYTVKSRWSEVQPCLSKAAINMENYRQNHGVYPTSFAELGMDNDCGDYYLGAINVFNDGQSYTITYMDSKKAISGSGISDVWVATDVSNKILHTSNPVASTDVDTPPDGYGAHIPSSIP